MPDIKMILNLIFKRYADKENLKKLVRYIKATFANKSEINENYYTKEQIDIMFEESSGDTGGGGTGGTGGDYYTKSQINIKLNSKANDSDVVHKSGDETIAGTKTFTSTIVGNVTGNASTATKATQDAAGNMITTTYATKAENSTKANDSDVVHKSGDETIAGTKTFSSDIVGNITGNASTATTATYASRSANNGGFYINNYLITIE